MQLKPVKEKVCMASVVFLSEETKSVCGGGTGLVGQWYEWPGFAFSHLRKAMKGGSVCSVCSASQFEDTALYGREPWQLPSLCQSWDGAAHLQGVSSVFS